MKRVLAVTIIARSKHRLSKKLIDRIGKTLSLILVLVMFLSSVSIVETACAQSISEPSERLYKVDLLYGYAQTGNSSAVAVLNFTKISNLTLPQHQGITEVYTVQIFSDGNKLSEVDKVGGIIGSGNIDGHIMLNLGTGGFFASGNIGLTRVKVPYKNLSPLLESPITMNLILLGWLLVNGSSTTVDFSSNQLIKSVELTSFGDGFLYNKLLSQEQLSSYNLFEPLNPQAARTTTNPSSSIPSPSISEFPTSLALTFLLMTAIAVAVVFRRKSK